MTWREEAPEGKLDLLLSADFRMTSTTLLSDIVVERCWLDVLTRWQAIWPSRTVMIRPLWAVRRFSHTGRSALRRSRPEGAERVSELGAGSRPASRYRERSSSRTCAPPFCAAHGPIVAASPPRVLVGEVDRVELPASAGTDPAHQG